MEYLLGTEAARSTVKHSPIPVQADVKPLPGAKPISEIKTIRPTAQEIEKGIPEVKEQWRDTFGI